MSFILFDVGLVLMTSPLSWYLSVNTLLGFLILFKDRVVRLRSVLFTLGLLYNPCWAELGVTLLLLGFEV